MGAGSRAVGRCTGFLVLLALFRLPLPHPLLDFRALVRRDESQPGGYLLRGRPLRVPPGLWRGYRRLLGHVRFRLVEAPVILKID